MRFRDLLPHFQDKCVGQVIQADWDPVEHGIRFTIRFEPSGRTLEGTCKAGVDPTSGTYISETDLRSKLPKMRDLPIYENATSGDPNTLSVDEFRKMKIHFSLSNLNFSYHAESRKLEMNTLLSRSLRR